MAARTSYYSGLPVLRPSGQLKLFKIVPDDFVEPMDFMYRMYGMPQAQGCAEAAIAKLAALVPKPRVNLTRFHGVFAPNNKHRVDVTPAKCGRARARNKNEDKTPEQRHQAMTDFCSCKTGISSVHGYNLGATPDKFNGIEFEWLQPAPQG